MIPLTVEALLQPLGLDAFRRQHWERRPAHVRGRPLPGLEALRSLPDRMLCERVLRRPDVRVSHRGAEVPFELLRFESRVPTPAAHQSADPRRLVEYLNDGATMIVQGTQGQCYDVALLVRDFEQTFRTNGFVDANLFVTRRETPGLPEHYDNEDLFVLQLDGCKTWSLREAPLPLPLPEQAFDRELLAGRGDDDLGAIVLEPGDLLYVPRGVIHRVQSAPGGSVHLTIGFGVHTWRDALERTLDIAALANASWREAVPLEWLEAEDDEPMVEQVLARLRGLDVASRLPDVLGSLEAEARREQRPLARTEVEGAGLRTEPEVSP